MLSAIQGQRRSMTLLTTVTMRQTILRWTWCGEGEKIGEEGREKKERVF